MIQTIGNPWLWGGFVAVVIAALLIDLVLMRHGGPHKVTFKEALLWSIGWVALALAFNAEKAAALGMRPGLTHAALMVMVTIAVVTSFQAVGTLMVFALIVAPPATAALFARRVTTVLIGGVLAGWLAAVAGLLLSFHAGTAGGASIAACTVGLFFVAFGYKEALEAVRKRRSATPPVGPPPATVTASTL